MCCVSQHSSLGWKAVVARGIMLQCKICLEISLQILSAAAMILVPHLEYDERDGVISSKTDVASRDLTFNIWGKH